MDIQFVAQIDASADVVAFPVRKGEAGALGALLGALAKQARFDGAAGSVAETAAFDGDRATRLLLVGIGEGTVHDLERAGGALTARLQTSGVAVLHVDFASAGQIDEDDVLAFAMGAKLRDWRIDTYRTRLSDTAKPSLKTIVIASPAGDISARWGSYSAVADGVALTQTLVAEPPNILYPESFVERCQHLADLGVEIEVLDERQMKALGMGALLGVAQGSVRPPRLLAMRWNGGNADDKPVVFIGKGVTFDTGGISLKPGPGMDMMKWDMGGAGAVAGAGRQGSARDARAALGTRCEGARGAPRARRGGARRRRRRTRGQRGRGGAEARTEERGRGDRGRSLRRADAARQRGRDRAARVVRRARAEGDRGALLARAAARGRRPPRPRRGRAFGARAP